MNLKNTTGHAKVQNELFGETGKVSASNKNHLCKLAPKLGTEDMENTCVYIIMVPNITFSHIQVQ